MVSLEKKELSLVCENNEFVCVAPTPEPKSTVHSMKSGINAKRARMGNLSHACFSNDGYQKERKK